MTPTHYASTPKQPSPLNDMPRPLWWHETGFSLIELMIVMVIIAVLASIAIPGFQDQVARSHVMGALSELRSLTTAYEDLALRGISEFGFSELGLQGTAATETDRCQMALQTPDPTTGDGSIECRLQGSPRIQDARLVLNRDGLQGIWSCISDIDPNLRPQSCEAFGDQ